MRGHTAAHASVVRFSLALHAHPHFTVPTMQAKTWTFHHSDNFLTEGRPTDARGLRLRMDSGYTFVNRNTGNGWEQITWILPGIEAQELTQGASQ